MPICFFLHSSRHLRLVVSLLRVLVNALLACNLFFVELALVYQHSARLRDGTRFELLHVGHFLLGLRFLQCLLLQIAFVKTERLFAILCELG